MNIKIATLICLIASSLSLLYTYVTTVRDLTHQRNQLNRTVSEISKMAFYLFERVGQLENEKLTIQTKCAIKIIDQDILSDKIGINGTVCLV